MRFRRGNPYRKYVFLFIGMCGLFGVRRCDSTKPLKAAIFEERKKIIVREPDPYIEVSVHEALEVGPCYECVGLSGNRVGYMIVPTDSIAGTSVTLGGTWWPSSLWRFENDGVKHEV
jgi:hypothetical protein